MEHSERTYDRQGLEVLAIEECWGLLGATRIGRVVFLEAGEPVVFPVNYALAGHTIAFLTTAGTKLEAASMARPVAFEIDSWDERSRSGWSVLVRGVADHVLDVGEIAELDALGLKPWAQVVERREWVRIRAGEVSGRRIV